MKLWRKKRTGELIWVLQDGEGSCTTRDNRSIAVRDLDGDGHMPREILYEHYEPVLSQPPKSDQKHSTADMVNQPPHYKHPSGIECIDITEMLSFTLGNAVKYIWRHQGKNGHEDLAKARWYLRRALTDKYAQHLPRRARALIYDVLDAEPRGDIRWTLLKFIAEGRIERAIEEISLMLGDK